MSTTCSKQCINIDSVTQDATSLPVQSQVPLTMTVGLQILFSLLKIAAFETCDMSGLFSFSTTKSLILDLCLFQTRVLPNNGRRQLCSLTVIVCLLNDIVHWRKFIQRGIPEKVLGVPLRISRNFTALIGKIVIAIEADRRPVRYCSCLAGLRLASI